jgi:hypothetical protein
MAVSGWLMRARHASRSARRSAIWTPVLHPVLDRPQGILVERADHAEMRRGAVQFPGCAAPKGLHHDARVRIPDGDQRAVRFAAVHDLLVGAEIHTVGWCLRVVAAHALPLKDLVGGLVRRNPAVVGSPLTGSRRPGCQPQASAHARHEDPSSAHSSPPRRTDHRIGRRQPQTPAASGGVSVSSRHR